jgi:hypothetical protein
VAGGDAAGSAEILDVAAGTSAAAGTMNSARSGHSAALLQDGRVLLVGGKDAGGNDLNSGEIFDGAFSNVGNGLVVARVRAHLRVLFDGKVQIIGGSNDGSMEVYDPSIAAFGAYAHVVPESDPCVGLHSHVLASQVRAALFHHGQSDPLLDRSGHTITELGGSALVLGGVNSSGAFLNSSVVNSSTAEITTDKLDYSPGEIALISGRGFEPGETVRVKIHEDPHTPQERGFDTVADGHGNFSGEYLVMDYDLDMKFIVGARGLSSGRTAQTTFTDANPQSIMVAAPTSVTVIQGATANYGNQTLVVGGNTNPCTVTFGVTSGLPAGATPVWGTNPVSTTGANVVTTFSVTTTGATPTGTYTFQVTGTNSPGCQGPGPLASNTLTLIVNAATVDTTTVVSNASATYGDSAVTLDATVTPDSGPAINSGSVTFTVKQGLTTIGMATTDASVVNGVASVNYLLPAGTDAGPYTIEASYTPGAGFNASSGAGALTINQRDITITADPQTKVYGEADPALTYQITSGSLVSGDTIVGALVRAAGENVGMYAITQGTLAIDDGNGGANYNLTFVGDNLTITARPLEVTATAGQFKIYGDADPVFAYSITSGSLAFMDSFTGALSRVAGKNVGLYAITIGTLSVNDGNGGANYNLTLVSNNFEIKKRAITVKADPQTKTFGDPDPVFTYQITSGSLAFPDTFTGALTRDPGELVGVYAIKIGTLAIDDGNGGNNYMLTFVGDNLTILTACSVFNGFLSPIGGAVEKGNGGSFMDPVRAFKLNSTIPVKFSAICFGAPLTTGVHTLQAIKYSNSTDSEPPIDATPTDAATTGNQFRLTGTEWHFNLSTKGLGNNGQGTWLLKATLFDGSTYTVWVSIKK